MRWFLLCALIAAFAADDAARGQAKPRSRDLGIPFEGMAGPLNAITDVKGVEVGYTTLQTGTSKLRVGTGPVRTGVTAILPRGKDSSDPVFAGSLPSTAALQQCATNSVNTGISVDGRRRPC
jgi:D-aminopeptidase